MRLARFTALLAPVLAAPLLASTVAATPARAAAAPTVAITSPADGSFADGLVTVTAVGTADAAGGDPALEMRLDVDGVWTQTLSCSPADPATCTSAFTLDTASLSSASHSLVVEFWSQHAYASSRSVLVGVGAPASFTSLDTPLSTTLYAVLGGVRLNARGTSWTRTAGLPISEQLVSDGQLVGRPVACAASVIGHNTCSVVVSGLVGGEQQVQARLTIGSTSVDSAPLTVTVLQPSVAITSPVAGSVTRGVATVTVVGTAAGPDDAPVSISVYPNSGVLAQTASCTGPAGSVCTATFQVAAFYLHSLTARFTTSHLTVSSGSLPLTPYLDEHIGVYAASVAAGHATKIQGYLTASYGSLDPAGVTIAVSLSPALGNPRIIHVPLEANGGFTVAYRPTGNTRITATLAAGPAHSAASATSSLIVTPAPRCLFAKPVRRGSMTALTCTLAHLPKGTRVTVQYSAHKRWHTAVTRVSTAGRAVLPFHWARSQVLWLRVVVAGNRVYGAYTGKPFSLKVS